MALSALLWQAPARADAAPAEWRSSEYYAINGAITAALIGGRVLTGLVREDLEAGGDTIWFPGDAGLRGRCSPEAANLSDASLALTVTVPVAAELAGGLDAQFVNAEVVYTQALFASRLLTSVAKVVFRRPRPFSYRQNRECDFDFEESDAYMSFYSGHSSNAFAAAIAGSYLLSESGLDVRTRSAFWGAQLALAGATANLRARAGKHYYSDIVVGALVGSGIGLAVPLLHGGDPGFETSEVLAGVTGLAVGIAGSQLVALGAEALVDAETSTGVLVSPLPVVMGYGLQAVGNW